MDELQRLRELVKKLERAETDQVEILQDIGKELVSHYVIRLPGNIEIQPLWVEAYYSDIDDIKAYKENIGKKFMDPFIHGNDGQKGAGNFGRLYFHHKTDDQRSGVDICLPGGSYYLSFLLKYTLVNGAFTTQSQLSGRIRKAHDKLNEEEQSKILYRIDNSTEYEYVTYTTRIGLKAEKEKNPEVQEQKKKYQSLPLAIVRDFHKTFSTAPSMPSKEKLVKQYLDSTDKTISQKVEFCKKYLGYCPSEYREK